MPRITALSLVRKPADEASPPTIEQLEERASSAFDAAREHVRRRAAEHGPVAFMQVERELWDLVLAVGRAIVVLFLGLREQQVAFDSCVEGLAHTFRPAPPIARSLTTQFGVVRYWRQYMREVRAKAGRRGFHPLDRALGLLSDRISFNVLAAAVRLATKLSFAEARTTMMMFMPNAPSTEVIEQTVLGFGRHTADWFETAPTPDRDGPDGEVLIVMADGKGAPTATETELKRRRRKRRHKGRGTVSKRHRGRERRRRYGRKPRRKKGDKSKNARVATLLLMYTLRREGNRLVGPLNVWSYASFAPKEHAFQIAQREANKRGFGPDSGKLVQFVSDGDNDLNRLACKYLPHAIQTIDCMHVVEKLWTAGECFYGEGSDGLKTWVEAQKKRLYAGRASLIVRELSERFERVPKTGPGNKGRRERLEDIIRYLDKRIDRMNYDELLRRDLEISSAPIEGAIKNVIGKRCDHGGMRWIRERVEALLQQRCIEMNGDWDRFTEFVHNRAWAEALVDHARVRLQSATPGPLPNIAEAA